MLNALFASARRDRFYRPTMYPQTAVLIEPPSLKGHNFCERVTREQRDSATDNCHEGHAGSDSLYWAKETPMPDDPRDLGQSEAERQGHKLAQEIDEAAADLETNGPVSPPELRRRLLELEAEWAAQNTGQPRRRKARRMPR